MVVINEAQQVKSKQTVSLFSLQPSLRQHVALGPVKKCYRQRVTCCEWTFSHLHKRISSNSFLSFGGDPAGCRYLQLRERGANLLSLAEGTQSAKKWKIIN